MEKNIEKYRDWLRDRVHESEVDLSKYRLEEYYEGKASGLFEAYAEFCRQFKEK